MKKSRFKEIVKEVLVEDSEYQIFFQKCLDKAGKSIPEMGTQEKRDFFNKIDAAWKGKGEKKNEDLVGNQTKLDVDKDGDIDASDLKKLRSESKQPLNEDAKKVWKKGKGLFVDSDFVNFSKGKLPNSELKHAGMGDFFLDTPNGKVYFIRTSEKFDGMSGRSHRITDNEQNGKLVALLIKKMKAKIVNESINEANQIPNLLSIMKSKYENQGYSLKKLHDEVIDFLGKKDGGLVFQEFISKNKSNKKIKSEFEKTAF